MTRIAMILVAALSVSLTAAGIEIGNPADWEREFVPEKLAALEDIGGGVTRFRRFSESTGARIFRDLKLQPGNCYVLTYLQSTTHGALDKVSVFFRQADGNWPKKGNFNDLTPLVNGEWTKGELWFQVPPGSGETRIAVILESFGTVELKELALREVKLAEYQAHCAALVPPPFQPGKNPDDIVVKSDSYQTVSFQAQAGKEKEGTVKIEFHQSDKKWYRCTRIVFFVPAGEQKEIRETLFIPENVDGLRFTATDCRMGRPILTELKLKQIP